MATHIIRAPEGDFEGDVGAVKFRAGSAEADEATHAAELRYFRAAGYGVEELEAPVFADVDGDGVTEELPKRSASTDAWRAFAASHGMTEEEATSKSRDELVAYYHQEDQ